MSPWGYRSSDGLGLLEFLEWCEELKMEPVLAVYAGLNLDNGRDVKTGEALKPLIQDALDEIQYVTGAVNTEWGARRAKDGHPAPFKLTYVEIGNEDFLNRGATTYRGPEGRFAWRGDSGLDLALLTVLEFDFSRRILFPSRGEKEILWCSGS